MTLLIGFTRYESGVVLAGKKQLQKTSARKAALWRCGDMVDNKMEPVDKISYVVALAIAAFCVGFVLWCVFDMIRQIVK